MSFLAFVQFYDTLCVDGETFVRVHNHAEKARVGLKICQQYRHDNLLPESSMFQTLENYTVEICCCNYHMIQPRNFKYQIQDADRKFVHVLIRPAESKVGDRYCNFVIFTK